MPFLPPKLNWNVYLAKYDVTGKMEWEYIYEATNNYSVSDMCIDQSGCIYIAGTTDVPCENQRVLSENNLFVVKINPSGKQERKYFYNRGY